MTGDNSCSIVKSAHRGDQFSYPEVKSAHRDDQSGTLRDHFSNPDHKFNVHGVDFAKSGLQFTPCVYVSTIHGVEFVDGVVKFGMSGLQFASCVYVPTVSGVKSVDGDDQSVHPEVKSTSLFDESVKLDDKSAVSGIKSEKYDD